MMTFMIRAAQTAFNRAGFDKTEAYQQASVVTHHLLEHFEQYQQDTGIDDAFELAYRVAREVAIYRAPIYRQMAKLA